MEAGSTVAKFTAAGVVLVETISTNPVGTDEERQRESERVRRPVLNPPMQVLVKPAALS